MFGTFMKNSQMNKRDSTFDVMKGIGIILMIIGHMHIPHLLRDFIFSFHMPMFFLIGGYFFKPRPFKEIIQKSANRLLKPYIITGLLTPILYLLVGDYDTARFRGLGVLFGNNGSPQAIIHTPLCGAVWFLLALFWCRLLFCYLYTKTHNWFVFSLILSILATAFGYYIVNPPLGIVIGMTALIFFSIGKALKEYNQNPRKIFILSVFIWFICVIFSRLEMAEYLYRCYPIDITGACGGSYVVYVVSKEICNHSSILKKVLLFVGVNSLLILCYHQLVDHMIAALNNNVFEIDRIYNMSINMILPLLLTRVHICVMSFYDRHNLLKK